jgi:hypothetical protein
MTLNRFSLRWHDPIYSHSAEFFATTPQEFCEAAIDAAIEFRCKSRVTLDSCCHYPMGHLQIRYELNPKWQSVRLNGHGATPMWLHALGSSLTDIPIEHESDVDRIRLLGPEWWEAIVKWAHSYLYYTGIEEKAREGKTP